MKIKFENQTVTIDTEMNVLALAGKKSASVSDDKGNTIYAVSKSTSRDGYIGDKYIECNAVTEADTLACVITLGADATVESFKAEYAEYLLAAKNGIEAVATKAAAHAAAINDLFAEVQ